MVRNLLFSMMSMEKETSLPANSREIAVLSAGLETRAKQIEELEKALAIAHRMEPTAQEVWIPRVQERLAGL